MKILGEVARRDFEGEFLNSINSVADITIKNFFGWSVSYDSFHYYHDIINSNNIVNLSSTKNFVANNSYEAQFSTEYENCVENLNYNIIWSIHLKKVSDLLLYLKNNNYASGVWGVRNNVKITPDNRLTSNTDIPKFFNSIDINFLREYEDWYILTAQSDIVNNFSSYYFTYDNTTIPRVEAVTRKIYLNTNGLYKKSIVNDLDTNILIDELFHFLRISYSNKNDSYPGYHSSGYSCAENNGLLNNEYVKIISAYNLKNSDDEEIRFLYTLPAGNIGTQTPTFMIINPDYLKSVLSAFQIPFVINDEDTAINSPVEDFTDYIPSGVPDNDITIGTGDGDNTSDLIPVPELPNINLCNTGFFSGYLIDNENLSALSRFVYSQDFIDNILNLFSNPIDGVISLNILPVTPEVSETAENIKITNVDSGVPAHKIINNYIKIDCGSININEYYGDYLDYDTKVSINIPFCGEHELNPQLIINSKLRLIYNIDIFSGSCVAILQVIKTNFNSAVYYFKGNVSIQIPITAVNYSQIYNSIINIAASLPFTNPVSAVIMNRPQLNHIQEGSASPQHSLISNKIPYILIERYIKNLPKNNNFYKGKPTNYYTKVSDLQGFNKFSDINLENNTHIPADDIEKIKQILKEGFYV